MKAILSSPLVLGPQGTLLLCLVLSVPGETELGALQAQALGREARFFAWWHPDNKGEGVS